MKDISRPFAALRSKLTGLNQDMLSDLRAQKALYSLISLPWPLHPLGLDSHPSLCFPSPFSAQLSPF